MAGRFFDDEGRPAFRLPVTLDGIAVGEAGLSGDLWDVLRPLGLGAHDIAEIVVRSGARTTSGYHLTTRGKPPS